MELTPKQKEAEIIKRRLARQQALDEATVNRSVDRKKWPSTPKKKKRTTRTRKQKEDGKAKKFVPIGYQVGMKSEFYGTKEWRELRWKVLIESDGRCVYCGRSRNKHGVTIHVDHIKPRSKYPFLELEKSNLQVTCEDCNLGKGAIDL